MSVHYKFKSALEYDTVTFDGLHISVKDLKNAIIQQKRIGKNTDFDLQVTNAQTKEVYEDEETLIPKNTSLLIARIPVIPSNKSKAWEGYGNDNAPVTRTDEGGPIAKAVDLSSLDASEDDKIRAMMSQSTQDYDPSNYLKIRGANQVGTVPPNYRCYKCHQTGHWIKDCPLNQGTEPLEIKKSTGIPRSFMVPVEGPQVQGAMMTPNGSYAVPVLDHQTYTQKQQPAPPPVQEEQPEIPEDLICSICSGLLTDAVMIPCCGNSFCDECIRSCLLESEDHECPDCHERDISPGTLIPNRYLRNSVATFKNTTGYVKKLTYKPQTTLKSQPVEIESEKKEDDTKNTHKETDPTDSIKSELVEKAVISEADSTEPPKNTNIDFSKDIDLNEVSKESPSKSSASEGPPGVSPRREKSPKRQSNRRGSHSSTSQSRSRRNSKDISPRPHNTRRSPPYEPMSRIEERPGTPTVDEPGGSNGSSNVYPPTSAPYPSAPPPGVLPPMIGMPPPHMQGPPPNYPPGQPPPGVFPSQGPPPNFRLPPPGTNNSTPYMSGPYNAPPRPIFDPSRPPLQGPPPNYSNYPPRSRNRDYRESSRMRTRTPPGIIDDPLEAFNRMLREKDERDRRAKQKKGRSYSRSSSRSYSRSPKRPRSRSPRRRNSRSRSRSFSMSRSRSRSFSPSPRNSPYRDYSPRNSSPRRRPSSRFRSPARSPPPRYRYKDGPINDRNRDRDFDRPPQRDRDRGFSRDRDYNYYERDRGGPRWGGAPPSRPPPIQDNYYPPEVHQLQPPPPSNRYPPRDNYQPPPFVNKNEPPHHMPPLLPPPNMHAPPQRRFDDIAPPGTDQPPIPGEELPPHYEERYGYQQDAANKEQFNNDREPRVKEEERRNFDNKPNREEEKPRRFDRYSRSPTRGYKSPRKSKERHESPDKHKRRKREHSEERDRDRREDRHEKKRELSDDEKSKRSKDKKKKREKKELEKKKRKERKERKEQDKAKKEDKEKKRDKDDIDDKEGSSEKYAGDKDRPDKKEEKIISKTPEKPQGVIKLEKMAKVEVEETPDLYDDVLSDGVDKSIMRNYGKLEAIAEEDQDRKTPEVKRREEPEEEFKEDNEYPPESETSKDEDVLDIHANEAELKAELDKAEVLAPLPEKSKWEMDDDVTFVSAEIQKEGKQERNGKVTNEVLKRAENAIFAKAINAIRPIEIKKISMDRAKLYSGEREKDRKVDEQDIRNIQVTISSNAFEEEDIHPPGTEIVKVESEIQKPPPRLSVKDRLGVKVDDLDRIVKVAYERNLSRSLSPLSKRAREERIHLDRRIEMDDRRRDDRGGRHERDRYHRNYRNLDRNEFRRREEYLRRERERREEQQRREERRERSRSQKDESKRKRSRSQSESKEQKHRKKDKKQRKEKSRKHKRDDKDDVKSKEESKSEKREGSVKPKSATDKRKATLDEANFEPDYDLDTESEKEDKKSLKDLGDEEKKRIIKLEEKEQKESSTSDSSDSSSEDDRKRKKHRKHKKKKSRKESSTSSSSSDTDSSEEERERKRKKHKKKQKKRKKSKHK